MKRLLSLIVLGAALVAGVLGIGRWQVERQNGTVEIVYDLPGLLRLAETGQIAIKKMFADLDRAGLNTIGVQPESLGESLLLGRPLRPSVAAQLPDAVGELGRLLTLPVAFKAEDFALVDENGLKAAPKLNTVPWDLEPVWLAAHPDLLILSGGGQFSPQDLHQFTGRLALVEFHTPGTAQLAGEVERMVRLHGISEGEMEILPAEIIVTRYLRAVRERNIRVLYLRPFLMGGDAWERSLDLIARLQADLRKGGYMLGAAKPFTPWAPTLFWRIIVSAGVWAGTALYGLTLFPKWARLFAGGAFFGWIALGGLAFGAPILAGQATALLAAVVFPCLALHFTTAQAGPLVRYLGIAAISLLGALLIVGTLTGPEYMLKIEEFRGVKLMHILPVFLVLFSLVRPLGPWLNKNVPVRYLVWAGFASILGILYVLRTGNFGLPVPSWEVRMREGLEALLYTRPRTKEFLLGHPALYLALHSEHPNRSRWLPLAVVGQVSLINTFTHIHSPLAISLLRTLYGLLFGYLLGWVFGQILRRGKGWLQRDHRFWILRLR